MYQKDKKQHKKKKMDAPFFASHMPNKNKHKHVKKNHQNWMLISQKIRAPIRCTIIAT